MEKNAYFRSHSAYGRYIVPGVQEVCRVLLQMKLIQPLENSLSILKYKKCVNINFT